MCQILPSLSGNLVAIIITLIHPRRLNIYTIYNIYSITCLDWMFQNSE